LCDRVVSDREHPRYSVNELFLSQIQNAFAREQLTKSRRPLVNRTLFERVIEFGGMPPFQGLPKCQFGVPRVPREELLVRIAVSVLDLLVVVRVKELVRLHPGRHRVFYPAWLHARSRYAGCNGTHQLQGIVPLLLELPEALVR